MNIIATTRASLGLTQVQFGAWLAERTGRAAPYPDSRVNEWEHGRRSPRRNIRAVCAPIAAGEVASDAVLKISDVYKDHADLMAAKDEIKKEIEGLIG